MTYLATILADHPTGFWRLNETAGSTAYDLSGNGYDATLSGATLNQAGALYKDPDTAAYFTSLGGLTVPASLSLLINTWITLSVEFWINLGTWQHVVVTWGGGNTILYLNGQVVSSSSTGTVLVSSTLEMIGSLTAAGDLDEVAIYGGVLSASTVWTHYTAGLGWLFGSYLVKIAGVPSYVLAGTLSIQAAIGRRSQASFVIHNQEVTTHYQQYQQVAIYDQNGALAFSGYITDPKEQQPGFARSLTHTITCCDQHYCADKRVVAATYVNRTIGYMVNDMVTNILAAEGVTVGLITDPGVAIPNATFVYCTVAAALDAMVKEASSSGIPYYWQIDQFKQLWFVPYTAIVNSNIIDGTQLDMRHSPPTVTRANPLYRNSQYITGGVAQTVTQHETRQGDGQLTTFTMGYDLASVPTITVNAVSKTVGIRGVDTGKDWYWQQGSPDISQDSSGTKLINTDTLAVTYIGQYPSIIASTNTAQVTAQAAIDGTSGIIEVVDTDNTLKDLSSGLMEASALLTRYGVQGTIFEGETLTSGYAQGQLVTFTLPSYGLNSAQMLIEELTVSDQIDGYNLYYHIKAVLGPSDTSWVQFFGSLFRPNQPGNSINVSSTSTVTLLVALTATITPTITLTPTAIMCPLPSSSLFPSSTLYPC